MNLVQIRIFITALATSIALIFICLIYLLPEHAIFLLTIEVILLPTIYIIGNCYAEYLIEERYKFTMSEAENDIELLKEKYINERMLNIQLDERIKQLKNEKNKK